MSNYLFNVNVKSETLPAGECTNGVPQTIREGIPMRNYELMYGVWTSYQKTQIAQFTNQQAEYYKYNDMPTSPQGPQNIFIIRHGEKNPTSKAPYCLDGNGVYRACKLVDFVNQLCVQGYPISYIVTCNSCSYNTNDCSMRPIQTISMASFMLNIPIMIYGNSQDYSATVNQLFNIGDVNNNNFNGLNVLICWEHTAIQGLTLSLLNAAGSLSRLPTDVIPTDGNVNLYGDAYFNMYSDTLNLCKNGNYLCPNDSTSPYYNDAYDLEYSGNTIPDYIGPNSYKYPYWNTNCFDMIHMLQSSPTNNIFKFAMFRQPIDTCYSSCDLQIGLYQPLKSLCDGANKYNNSNYETEENCQVPTGWNV